MSKRLPIVLTLVALIALLTVGYVVAGNGNGKGKGKPGDPPPCECPETIELPNGTVCTLEACGSDCVYVCPLP